jgi:cell division protein FtsW
MEKKPDYILIGIVTLLSVIGILVLASVSFSPAHNIHGNVFYFLSHQIKFGFLPGIILAFIFFKIEIPSLKKRILPLLILNLLFLVIVFLPVVGSKAWGATRWVSIGPFSFQPSEFLKVFFILYLASWLKKTSNTFNKNLSIKKSKRWIKLDKKIYETLFAFLIIVGFISFLLILQPDISTLGIIAIIALLMYFLAGAPLWHVLLLSFSGIGILLALIKIAPYRMNRFLIFMNPELYPQGIGYHLKQSLIAVGSGGIRGLGMGLSRQRFGFLPGVMSDSVFSIFAEETGFIGCFVLILLFIIFLIRGFEIAQKCDDKFLQLTALGIVSWIVIQAFVNIGAMISLVPLTGIPLPFISYGGSAIIAEFIGLGILLNISKHSKI